MPPLARLCSRRPPLSSSCCAVFSVPALSNRSVTPPHHLSRRDLSSQVKGGLGRTVLPPRTAPRQSQPQSELESRVFTSSSVPPISFFRDQLPLYGSPDLTPAQCHEACTAYCDATTATTTTTRDLPWAKRLVASQPRITPYLLHYLGVILVDNPPTQDLGFSMLVTAHELEYTPSTLQLVLLLERSNPVASRNPSSRLPAPFRSAIAKHAALVRAGRDPSALALQAHLLSTKGDHRGAVDYFSRAYRAGTALLPSPPPSGAGGVLPRKPRWLLEGTTLLVHGQRLLKDGRRAEAEAAVRVAAVELDQPQAYAALAQIVGDRGEREGYTLRAAMAGIRSACEGMAKVEAERAEEAGLGGEERRMRALIAKEWAVLGA